MSRPRQCPHCGRRIPVLNGYTFDQELNLRCGNCGKVIFPATVVAETDFHGSQKMPPQDTFGSETQEDEENP
jgi:hypothetical protein